MAVYKLQTRPQVLCNLFVMSSALTVHVLFVHLKVNIEQKGNSDILLHISYYVLMYANIPFVY